MRANGLDKRRRLQRSELATATFAGFWASLARMRVRLSLMGAALRAASHSSGFKAPSQPSALWTARGRKAHQFAIAELIESISGRSSQGISETGIDMHGAHAQIRAPLANSSLMGQVVRLHLSIVAIAMSIPDRTTIDPSESFTRNCTSL
jgi:hypothetical protein